MFTIDPGEDLWPMFNHEVLRSNLLVDLGKVFVTGFSNSFLISVGPTSLSTIVKGIYPLNTAADSEEVEYKAYLTIYLMSNFRQARF